jgi:hypothetical protein
MAAVRFYGLKAGRSGEQGVLNVSLTQKKAERINAPGLHHDSKGLYLQVTGGGRAKSWLWRFKHNKREHLMGLGSLHDRSLEEARAERDALRKILKL